ncbi:PEGA domain-containing protein [Pyxidicoccus parkwayensis]|uniref:PEGA domain-containing protein n=1 Tax=Pyxidicoccus parkwayensis TaxID=2813578 RepID=A0ABX7NVK6_9BACT|nr:PEGA domain-containing protein [Pyxidicoccus parkwaysis]QSQ22835.1 PEGA domain-containing protein [Pyxidicoccus parkwaysis]
MKQSTWIAVILLGTVTVNGVMYGVVRSRRSATPDTPVATHAPRPPTQAAAPSPVTVASVTPAPEDDANAGLARARRAAGLAALEDRDYETAVAEFTEALRLRKDDKGDLVELLRIAAELRTREQSRTQHADRTRAVREPAAPTRKESAKARPVRVASRTSAREETSAAAEEPRNGLLLVTSTPPGLQVLVDGKTVDLTPARVPLKAGTYRVALAQGDRKLSEETVELGEDDVHSLNKDLSAELAPPPSRPAPQPVVTAPPAPTSPAATMAAAQPTSAPEPAPPPTTTAARAATGKGDLDVTSPALYGEVWINNRPYGFPPLKAQGLPAGPARVEVRVNGVVKRKMTVEVEPDRLTAVRVR